MSTPLRSEEQRKAAEAAMRRVGGVAQPRWPLLRRGAVFIPCLVTAISVVFSVVYVVVVTAWAWLMYACRTITEPWVLLWKLVTSIISYLSPPPDPTLRDRLVEAAEDAREAATRAVFSVETLSWLCGGTMLVVLAYCSSMVIVAYLQRTLWRFKGYEWEGLQTGSEFGSGRAPPCQVQISWLGALRDKHSGYGIRCGQMLVLPLHVVRGQEQVLLTSQRGSKMIVPVRLVESATMNDVGYMQLTETTWSKLGVKDSTISFTMGIASCTGLSGTSVGRVSRSSTMGLLNYRGSTVPGMSGAAYAINSQVIGMHIGMVRGINAGVSMELIGLEMRKLTQESAIGMGDDEEVEKAQPMWGESDLRRIVSEAYDDVTATWSTPAGEARERVREAVRRGLTIDWAAEEAAKSIKQPRPKPRTVTFDYVQQSDDQGAAVLEVKTVATRMADLEDDVSELRQEMAQVQKRLSTIEGKREPVAKAGPKEYLKCELCDTCTITPAGMENHLKNSHPVQAPKVLVKCEDCGLTFPEKSLARHKENSHRVRATYQCECGVKCRTAERLSNHKVTCTYKPESAFPSDFKKAVKQDRFLGQRRSQRERSGRNSPAGSSKSASRGPSPSREEPQNELKGFLLSLNDTLKGLREDMSGLTSAIMPKSDH